MCLVGLPLWLSGKELPASAGDVGPISVGKIPWRRNWLQYSCLGNLIDRGAWRATANGVAERQD